MLKKIGLAIVLVFGGLVALGEILPATKSQKIPVATLNSRGFVEPQSNPPGYAEQMRRQTILDNLILEKRSYTGRSNDPLTATITFNNKNSFTIKDFTVLFTFHGNSGTIIGSRKKTFYEIMPPNKPKTIRNISLGFMPDQGSSVSAEVVDYGIP